MTLRVLGCGGGSSFDIQQALLYAAGLENTSGQVPSTPASIANLSLGGGGSSRSEQEVYTRARNAGLIIIAAAGNSASSTPEYPASYDGVVSVSATGITDQLASYSNFGSTVDVSAPGGDSTPDVDGNGQPDAVLSTDGDDASPVRETIEYKNGTSMATPHVAGVVALMKSIFPALTPDQFDNLLAAGTITDDLGATGRDNQFGHGRINALKAVRAAQDLAGGTTTTPTPTPVLRVNPGNLNFGRLQTSLNVSVENAGTGTLNVTSATSSESFVTVTAPTASNGLGSYTIAIDRNGLNPGLFTATVAFVSDNAGTVNLGVRFEVAASAADAIGETGTQFIILVDPETGNTIAQDVIRTPTNGQYLYTIENVPAGTYEVVGGTDLNNDGFVGDPGEAFGGFRAIDAVEPVQVNGNLTNIDFPTEYLGTVNAAQSSDAAPPRRPTFRRLPTAEEKKVTGR